LGLKHILVARSRIQGDKVSEVAIDGVTSLERIYELQKMGFDPSRKSWHNCRLRVKKPLPICRLGF